MNKVLLGTANFMNEYRGVKLNESQCIEILKEFEKLGGKIINTADNYRNAKFLYDVIKEHKLKLQVLYKYNASSKLHLNNIEVGHSVYYPCQLDQFDIVTEIPNSNIFEDYLPILSLHSQIYVRSNFMIDVKYQIKNTKYINAYIVGVDNIKQLRENMRVFNG